MEFLADEYLIAWLLYLGAFLMLYWAFAKVVWYLPLRILRQTVKALFALVFLTPASSPEIAGWLTPAWLQLGYAVITGEEAQTGRLLVNYGIGFIIMLVALSADAGLHRWRRRRR